MSVLARGLKIATPYRDTNDNTIKHTDPVYSANPMAILRWFDVHYRGIDPATIDDESYLAAYDACEETITYRYGSGTPSDADGADGEWYVREDGHLYQRQSGAWVDLRTVQGNYAWLSGQGTNGVYEMPRYRCHLEIEVGDDVLDTYRKILATCAGARYPHQGKILYRVGVDRPVSLQVPEAKVIDVDNFQSGIPYNERVNSLSARLTQSEENDWLSDDIEFRDLEAEEIDGEPKDAQFELDGVTNPIQGYNLLSTYLAQMREPMEADVLIDWMPDMAQLNIQPLDIIELTHPTYKWASTKVEVVHAFARPDLSVEARVRLFSAKEYKPTLTLPGADRRPIRFVGTEPALDLTGLRAEDRIDVRHDAVRNWTDVFWNPVVAAGTEVEYQVIAERRFPLSGRVVVRGVEPTLTLIQAIEAESGRAVVRGGADPTLTSFNRYLAESGRAVVRGNEAHATSGRSIFDPTVTLRPDRGLYFRQTGLKPLGIGTADATNVYGTDQDNRFGDWLNYQGVPNSAALPFRQLAFERGGDGIPDGPGIPILGTTTEAAEELQFRRFGVYAENARSDLRNMTLLQLVGLGETGGIPSNDFSDDQKRDWRMVMRDSNHNAFVMSFPSVTEDPDNPYLWADDETVRFRGFIRRARAAGGYHRLRHRGFDLAVD